MYRVKLENFSGPLDLLLYFIRRDKIDIYDIPIASITKEYMDTMGHSKTEKKTKEHRWKKTQISNYATDN